LRGIEAIGGYPPDPASILQLGCPFSRSIATIDLGGLIMEQNNELNFQVLIEEDKAQGDFTAYIPAFRLGAQGDSLEDVRENVKDLLLMEIESRVRQGKRIPSDGTATIETISISLPIFK
jgi:predicted RNase H-like HicB family nuclease